MGKKHSDIIDNTIGSADKADGKRERSPDSENKTELNLDLENLGAGYNSEDKRVARAIKCYQEQLLPFIQKNQSMFSRSNILGIRGYAIKSDNHDDSGGGKRVKR